MGGTVSNDEFQTDVGSTESPWGRGVEVAHGAEMRLNAARFVLPARHGWSPGFSPRGDILTQCWRSTGADACRGARRR